MQHKKILMYAYLVVGIMLLTVSAGYLIYIYAFTEGTPLMFKALFWIFAVCGAAWIGVYFRLRNKEKANSQK
jgi:hypothetical protein